ncbi:metallophosphoesterase [Afipia sp. 1NLS2]|uniref:metallophosphoesterase n=1 Tax=Afipia sp. 1NLS2 TaxID=666684 RepID=UPI0001D9E0E8|nr:metallophosphoesterase [Afipia sp. 1NLS2]EFI53758.1 metallophosphoesterase [Afipia sp. 1NLS2]
MKIQIFSDLHADVAAPKTISIADDVDTIVVAGDTCAGIDRGLVILRKIVPQTIPIIVTAGNHEFYRRCWPEELALAHRLAPQFNAHVLENETVVVGGVRFIGATMWTDYRLFGENLSSSAMHVAQNGLNDHRLILTSKQPFRRLRPVDALRLHQQSRIYIQATLQIPFAGPTVVVTHHAPHRGSIHPHYKDDLLTAAYVSDLSEILLGAQAPDLWVHGHIHKSSDYWIGKSQVVCNPHGYGDENSAFNPSLTIEVGHE